MVKVQKRDVNQKKDAGRKAESKIAHEGEGHQAHAHVQEGAHAASSPNPFSILKHSLAGIRSAPLGAFLALVMDAALMAVLVVLFAQILPRILMLLKEANELITPSVQSIDFDAISEGSLPQLALESARVEVILQQVSYLFIIMLLFIYAAWSVLGSIGWHFTAMRHARVNILSYVGRVLLVNVFWFVLLVGLLFGYASSLLYVPIFKELWNFTFFFFLLCILYFVPLHHAYLLEHSVRNATRKTFGIGIFTARWVFANYFVVVLVLLLGFMIVWLLSIINPALILVGVVVFLLPAMHLCRLQVLGTARELERSK